jgi:hypothetical protein
MPFVLGRACTLDGRTDRFADDRGMDAVRADDVTIQSRVLAERVFVHDGFG